MFSQKISASTCSSKEKAGLKRKKKMKNNYDDTKIVKSNSRVEYIILKVRMRSLGRCIGRYWLVDYC